ncbi:MAG: shikimate dehydrogenase [Solirubrobacteraceae bacterium]
MNKLGLIGKNISYSFSKKFFTKKFEIEKISNYVYNQFDIPEIKEVEKIFEIENILGLNVTIPYKEQVIPYLDELSIEAKEIGAVNTIKIINNKKIGFNTDCFGFENSIIPLLKTHHKKALILGTGGASKAIKYALNKLAISYKVVSRKENNNENITYQDLNKEILENYTIIINCSPVGTFPSIENFPLIPYEYISPNHLAYDLIYNPSKTSFLTKCEEKGATIKNGLEMLELQALKAWEIWTK